MNPVPAWISFKLSFHAAGPSNPILWDRPSPLRASAPPQHPTRTQRHPAVCCLLHQIIQICIPLDTNWIPFVSICNILSIPLFSSGILRLSSFAKHGFGKGVKFLKFKAVRHPVLDHVIILFDGYRI